MLQSEHLAKSRVHRHPALSGFFGKRIENILEGTGIRLNGSNPWDLQVIHPGFYWRSAIHGSLGLGETYVEGLWECQQLDEFFYRILRADVENQYRFLSTLRNKTRAVIRNLQTRSRAFQVGQQHYDLGNDVYRAMLDQRMVYTCGYWERAADLEQAQEQKLELTCRKLQLQPGMRVLDVGCGWGSFARYAAEHYQVEVTGVTVSREQVELGQKLCRDLPVRFELKDYRDIRGEYDRIVSLGMLEHVGHKNYRTYMDVVCRCLKSGGLFVLQTIGKRDSSPGVDPWIERYIFPNSELPSLKLISAAAEKQLILEDVHNFGSDYDKTLLAWFNNFRRAWPKLCDKYSNKFYRMWKYYLLSCAGAFRARDIQLWQVVFSKGGLDGAYRRPGL